MAALKRKRDATSDIASNKHCQVSSEEYQIAPSSSDHGAKESDEEEDQDWTGFQDLAEDPIPKQDDTSSDRVHKPTVIPSGHEVRVMKEATELYKSSSFKLKIDALLPTVRPKYDSSAATNLEFILRQLHDFILSMSAIAPLHPLEASAQLLERAVAVPYCQPLPTEDTNWKVSFERPADVKLVGSWANKLSVKAKDGEKFCIDVGVEMPNTLFQEKDYLNGRFFHKRAFYIATIAAELSEKFPASLGYQSTFDDPRLTTLVLRSMEDKSKNDFSKLNAQIQIIPILQSSSPIPVKHLSPSRCNIRISQSSRDSPTPHYNSALLLCLTPVPHLLTSFDLKRDVQSFADALVLLRVWANQRGYGEGPVGWNVAGFAGRGTLWSSILALLIKGGEVAQGKTKKLNAVGKGLSSYQLFKAALGFLARHDFEKEPVYMKSNGEPIYADEHETHHESVFVDSSSIINLLHGISINSLQMLRQDAKISLDLLNTNSESEDSFSEAFLQEKRYLSTRFDIVIRVDLSSAKPKIPSNVDLLDVGSSGNWLLSSLASTLRRGLGNRVKAVTILRHSSTSRPLTQALPFTPSTIQIGLILDPEHAFRLVDHGPSAEDVEADSSFRNFWGEDKAELRRFKDGRILESVVWDIKTVDEKAHIPGLIAAHILRRHFGIDGSSAAETWQSNFDNVLRLPLEVSGIYDRFSPKVGFKMAMVAFDTLAKRIKELSDLPLAVLTISPVSDHLRYTGVFSPVAIPMASMGAFPQWMRYLPAMEVIVEFEKSTKWPDDLKVIQKTKLAFFEQTARSIMEAEIGAKAKVVIGDASPTSDIEDCARLDIVTPEGWAFSLRIWHDREAVLLDRIIDNKPHAPKHLERHQDDTNMKDRRQAVEAKDVYMRRFIHAPKHHRAVLNLCHRYTAFAGTVRLVKRWFATHWFLGVHVSSEAVELICAKIYIGNGDDLRGDVDEGKDDRPGLPITKERGFSTVIKFLSEWRWEEGLIVPVYGSREPIKLEGATAVSDTSAWRLFTGEDLTGKMWTRNGPDAVVARRVTSFAKATWHALEQGINTQKWDIKTIYNHPTIDYDFIIELDAAVLPRSHQNISAQAWGWLKDRKYRNIVGASTDEDEILLGFDPVQLFLGDLKRVYTDTIMFFNDIYGGDRVGGIWLPILKGSRQFKVLGGFSSTPLAKEKGKDNGLVMLNKRGVLAEIERMGKGMISRISVQESE